MATVTEPKKEGYIPYPKKGGVKVPEERVKGPVKQPIPAPALVLVVGGI